jgi:S-adenosylmethionine-diacylglycerol 3-amino-3-carboxypropyl transferase
LDLYDSLRKHLTAAAQRYWDANDKVIAGGLLAAGKFERYFALFRRWILPLTQSRGNVETLFAPRSLTERREFYQTRWNNWRWRALFRLFFSRLVMGRLGRDPSFFDYVEGEVAAPLFARAERALTVLDPARNPYLQWIVSGRFVSALPHAWRAENFAAIRSHIDRLEIELASVESYLARTADGSIDRFNLSDIFEYISESGSMELFQEIARCGRAGGRLAYWNMQAPRRCPPSLAGRVHTLSDLSRRLYRETTTFFYSGFYVEELE